MKLPAMRFKGFSWPKNPGKLKMETQRDLKEHTLPYAGSLVQDYGRKRRKISGEGVFLGEKALASFQELSALLEQGGSGLLILPEFPAMMATLVKLELVGETTPHAVRYSFEFWEDLASGAEGTVLGTGRSHRCQEGEDVWTIANRYRTQAEVVLAVNPQIQWPNFLREGEVVHLP